VRACIWLASVPVQYRNSHVCLCIRCGVVKMYGGWGVCLRPHVGIGVRIVWCRSSRVLAGICDHALNRKQQ
jgi:hypothetical protein